MSRWTSSVAIERDLSQAQGGSTGAAPRHALGARERPPALRLHEETEEEYFRQGASERREGAAAGVAGAAPDLALIQHMLQMVRDLTEPDAADGDAAVITKMSPTAAPFVPAAAGPPSPPSPAPSPEPAPHHVSRSHSPTLIISLTKVAHRVPRPHPLVHPKPPPQVALCPAVDPPALNACCTKPPAKVKKYRNIAILSIMQAIQSCERKQNTNIFIPKPSQENACDNVSEMEPPRAASRLKSEREEAEVGTEASDKVTDWLARITAPIRQAKPAVVLDASNIMFKKKRKPVEEQPAARIAAAPVAGGAGGAVGAYVPSSQARQYYDTLVEKSIATAAAAAPRDDLWTALERDMRRRNETRRQVAAQRTHSAGGAAADGDVAGETCSREDDTFTGRDPLWRVRLPAPRHPPRAACDQCVVCRACRDGPLPRGPQPGHGGGGGGEGDGEGTGWRASVAGDVAELAPPTTPPSEYDTASDESH